MLVKNIYKDGTTHTRLNGDPGSDTNGRWDDNSKRCGLYAGFYGYLDYLKKVKGWIVRSADPTCTVEYNLIVRDGLLAIATK